MPPRASISPRDQGRIQFKFYTFRAPGSRLFCRFLPAILATSSSTSINSFSNICVGAFLFPAITTRTVLLGSDESLLNNCALSFLFPATNCFVMSSIVLKISRISSGTVLLCATHLPYSGCFSMISSHTSIGASSIADRSYSIFSLLSRSFINSSTELIISISTFKAFNI